MYLVDTNILLRFLLPNDPAYSAIRKAVRILKMRREQLVTTPPARTKSRKIKGGSKSE